MSIKLSNITNKNEKNLYEIVSNLDIMKYVGNRKAWNKKKTQASTTSGGRHLRNE